MPAADRDFVLDLALFDPLDPELVDEVTGAGNAGRRIASMGALAGLLSTTGGGGPAMRLHPLVKDYCEKRRFEEDPDRYRTIHRGIARALVRRGRVVEALRHAAEAGDAELLGRLAEGTGGARLWLEQGLEVLRTVDALLSAEVLSCYPRMALVRCVVLTSSGDIEEAKRVYEAAAGETSGFTRDREGGDDRALQTEHIFVQGLLHMCGCVPYGGGIVAAIGGATAAANAPDTDPLLRGMFSLGMCIAHNQTTAFEPAVEWAGRARATLGRGSPYLAHVDFQGGSVAMARGRTGEAHECYDRALKVARASHLRDAGAVMIGEALAAELELERSAGAPRLDGRTARIAASARRVQRLARHLRGEHRGRNGAVAPGRRSRGGAHAGRGCARVRASHRAAGARAVPVGASRLGAAGRRRCRGGGPRLAVRPAPRAGGRMHRPRDAELA